MPDDTAPADTKPLPVHKARSGALQLAVWSNTRIVDDQPTELFSIEISRSFKDRNDEWAKSKINLRKQDLGMAIAMLQNAQTFFIEQDDS